MAVLTFIGGGSFGTALGVHLAKNGHTIKIWDIDEKNIEEKVESKDLASDIFGDEILEIR